MIINTGNRTDIPAYYSEWFYNRIKEGYVLTRNPYSKDQINKYLLNPLVVDCINFCTKNPEPMLHRIEELADFRQLWYVTITPYGKEIEPYVPGKESVIESFKRLSAFLGADSVIWRYDPIFISEKYSLEFHVDSFENMAGLLAGYTRYAVISFIDLYEKTRRNFPAVRQVSLEECEVIGKEFARIGRKYGMTIKSCCEGDRLQKYGVDTTGCMTPEVIERAIGIGLKVPKGKGAREGCDCLLGNDIGMYNTCGHGCLYCYANYDQETVKRNMKLHDKTSPLLTGQLQTYDIVHCVSQESWIDNQLRLKL